MNERPSDWEPKVLAFMCNWCLYTKADQADIAKAQELSDVRLVKVPCSGRINPLFILKALEEGHDGVLVVGCHPGDCHYNSGNYKARRRIMLLKNMLPQFGIEPERLRLEWISASEASRFQSAVNGFIDEVTELGPLTLNRKVRQIERATY